MSWRICRDDRGSVDYDIEFPPESSCTLSWFEALPPLNGTQTPLLMECIFFLVKEQVLIEGGRSIVAYKRRFPELDGWNFLRQMQFDGGNHLHTSFVSLFIISHWYCLSVTVYKVLFCVTQVKVVIPGWPALVSGVGDELAPVLTRGWRWGGRLPLEHHFHNWVMREVAYFSPAQRLHLKSSTRWRETLFHACTHY